MPAAAEPAAAVTCVPEPRGRLYRACVRLLIERGNTTAVEILTGLDPWRT